MPIYTAVDLGATSGRVVNVRVESDAVVLDVVRRFSNQPVAAADGGLVWDFDGLLAEMRAGLVEAAARGPIASVGIDSWAVDYGLLDANGRRVGPVHSYRSSRADGAMEAVTAAIGRERLYDVTGIQFLPFNTVFQLAAGRQSAEYKAASTLLMVPDLLNHELCGSTTNEATNASTTQLLDAQTHEWSDELLVALGLRRDVMPALHQPGTRLGVVRGVSAGVDGTAVVAVASHDTASAVAGTPLRADRPGIYISCGTWSLVGCELAGPVTTARALAANVTNELGVGGTTRLLKNVTGLWLLEECRRSWAAVGTAIDIAELVADAARLPAGRAVIDPDDPRLAGSGAMPDLIAGVCRDNGQHVPETPAEVARVILDSLALAWRRTVRTIEAVAGFRAEVIHLVGGGAANSLLAALCASACERPVLVGPVEATVVGNAIVQAIADGFVANLSDLAAGRALIERALPPTVVMPALSIDWNTLESRLVTAGTDTRGVTE